MVVAQCGNLARVSRKMRPLRRAFRQRANGPLISPIRSRFFYILAWAETYAQTLPLQIPEQHCALLVQPAPEGRQVAACTAFGATIELTTGNATEAAMPIRFMTSRRDIPELARELVTTF